MTKDDSVRQLPYHTCMANENLGAAKQAKNDEFYTQYADIEKEMNADHVSAWSKGGATSIGNCQMLCKTHNRSKGNA